MSTATLLPHDQYARFRALVADVSGIEVPDSRRRDLENAVMRSLEQTGSDDTAELYRLLTNGDRGRRALDDLVGMLTIGETHFFRNRPQFEALEREILPDLIRRRRDTRRLRIWSAGCATGEEPYSIAILVKRLLPDLADWHVTILATDIDRSALERAREGLYRRWSFREVPEDIQAGWFRERSGRFEIHAQIRALVTFDYLNLVEDVYPSIHTNTHAMDLILCRNVLMYFRPDVSRRVVARLDASLSHGGWLVVGHTDPSDTLFSELEARHAPGTVLYRKPGTVGALVDHPPDLGSRLVATPVAATGTLPVRRSPRARSAPAREVREEGTDLVGAIALLERGKVGDARRALERIAERRPSEVEAPHLLAKIAANELELEVAHRWTDEALRRSSLHAPSHYLRGLLHQADEQAEAALDSYRRCVYADPEFALGHFALAGLFAQLDQRARARTSLSNVSRLLAGRERDELLPDGDGMTVGRLLELVAVHLGFLDADHGGGRD